MVDPKASHRSDIQECEKQIDVLKSKFPETYFLQSEFRKLTEMIRQSRHSIEKYGHMIKAGVKF